MATLKEEKEDWQRKYRSVLMERNPTLKQLRIEETDDTQERQRLDHAIEMLNLLRNRT